MTSFEWAMISVTAIGVIFTGLGMIVATTRGVEGIRLETVKLIQAEVVSRTAAISAAVEEESRAREKELLSAIRRRDEIQDTQYQEFGETATALRRFIEEVEREMHKIEVWGRDHYVQKPEFDRAIDALSVAMRDGFAGIKSDLGTLRSEIRADMQNQQNQRDKN